MAVARLRLRRTPRDPEARMGVIDHLEELRFRIVVSAITWFVCTILAWIFVAPIIDLIRLPIDEVGEIGGYKVNDLPVQGVATAFVMRIKLAAMAGVIVAMPVIMWQIFRFIAPGLKPKERKIAIPFIGASILLFALGAAIAFLLLPAALKFLLGFSVDFGEPFIFFQDYVSFVSLMVLAFGTSFEVPLIIVALGAIGAVSSQTLRKKRAWALVIAFLIGAVATPGGDPLSQTLMAVPLFLLYEAAILVIRFAFKK